MGRLNKGKAGRESGILTEMVKATCCDGEFLNTLLDLVYAAWKEKRVPK